MNEIMSEKLWVLLGDKVLDEEKSNVSQEIMYRTVLL
jgi:hypothetical protein